MKVIRKIGIWKIIIFLVVIVFLFSCHSRRPLSKARIVMNKTDNITATTATVVATVIPNGANTMVSFSYRSNNFNEAIKTVFDNFCGSKPIKVTFDLVDLQPNTTYKVKAMAANSNGSTSSIEVSFTTAILPKPVT